MKPKEKKQVPFRRPTGLPPIGATEGVIRIESESDSDSSTEGPPPSFEGGMHAPGGWLSREEVEYNLRWGGPSTGQDKPSSRPI